MREIKFRVWDNISNEMLDWYELVNNPKLLRDCLSSKDVISIELMQFTGLHDKNGKEIFEGDVVKSIYSNEPAIIQFGEYLDPQNEGMQKATCIGFYTKCENGFIESFGKSVNGELCYHEVIGNIYENANLLS